MKLLRYKNLTQFVDFTNLYRNSYLLADLFMFTEDYFLFIKKNDSNEVWMTKETFAGGFEYLKIPFQTWGISVNSFILLKFYSFSTIGVNLMSFKINSEQFATIIENDAGDMAIYIDNTDDERAINFITTACPLTVTKEDENQTIHSFNNKNDGTNSSMLFNISIDQSNYSDITFQSLNSVLTNTTFSALSFNILISSSQSTRLSQIYSMVGGSVETYFRNIDDLQPKIFNQFKVDTSISKTFNSTSVENYIQDGISNDRVLVTFNNNSMIYYDLTGDVYYYKNLFRYHTTDSSEFNPEIFDSTTKFNLFKEMLRIFHGINDVSKYRLSKATIGSSMFMRMETNFNLIKEAIYRVPNTYFAAVSTTESVITQLLGSEINASLTKCSYITN